MTTPPPTTPPPGAAHHLAVDLDDRRRADEEPVPDAGRVAGRHNRVDVLAKLLGRGVGVAAGGKEGCSRVLGGGRVVVGASRGSGEEGLG
jgi:hypothetical protein